MAFNFNFDFKFNFGRATVSDFSDFCKQADYPPPFPLQEEMKRFIFKKGTPRLVLGARRYGKTDYGTILGSAAELFRNANEEILIITKEQGRGKEIVEEIRAILERFGVQFENRAKTKIRLKGKRGKEPNLNCLTIRSKGLRGRHPDLIIMEDPITPDDVSAAERRRVKRVYEELYKLTENICVIGQPVHKADLYQELRGVVPTLEMKYGDIPELDVDLDAQRAAGVSEESIQANYFLNVMDADSLPFLKVQEVDFWAKSNVMYIDPAREGKDFTAFAVAGRNFDNWVVAGFAWRRAWYDLFGEMKEIFERFNVGRVCIETNGIGENAVYELRGMGVPCVGKTTTTKKYARIMNAAGYAEDLRLTRLSAGSPSLLAGNQSFIEQVKNFEYNVEHDDAPDALAGSMIFAGVMKE